MGKDVGEFEIRQAFFTSLSKSLTARFKLDACLGLMVELLLISSK